MSSETPRHEDPNEVIGVGEVLPDSIAEQLRPPRPVRPEITPLELSIANRPLVRMGETLAKVKADTAFAERDSGLRILHDAIGLLRHLPGGHTETYNDKLSREEKKGLKESASYGMAKIGNSKISLYATHWDFFAGSIGSVAGEKFVKAVDLALGEKAPLVGVYSSSGVRQQENFAGLVQMSKMIKAVNRYREKSDYPSVSVLLGQVWGGVSASVVPMGDITIGLAGTDYGFSGPNVIESYEGKPVEEGAQSIESHAVLRNIDIIAGDERELMSWLERFVKHTEHKTKLTADEGLKLPPVYELSSEERFRFGEDGYTLLHHKTRKFEREGKLFEGNPVEADDLYKRFLALSKDARRPDTEYLMRQCFTDVLPLYNSLSSPNKLEYPAIIASLGKIDGQDFLIIGNQPSYQKVGDRIVKIPSSPSPEDFRYLRRMLSVGERLNLSAVFFTDTLGAKPTLSAEKNDQNREIAETISAGLSYKNPVLTIITGVLGSGGGLATAPLGVENVAMLENAMAFVAEPRSATAILNRKPNPTENEIRQIIDSMRATAADQLELGLIDTVITEGMHDGWNYPAQAAEAIRAHIVRQMLLAQELRQGARLRRRDKKLRNLEGIPLK